MDLHTTWLKLMYYWYVELFCDFGSIFSQLKWHFGLHLNFGKIFNINKFNAKIERVQVALHNARVDELQFMWKKCNIDIVYLPYSWMKIQKYHIYRKSNNKQHMNLICFFVCLSFKESGFCSFSISFGYGSSFFFCF